VKLTAKWTTIVAAGLLATVLSGIGFYGRQRSEPPIQHFEGKSLIEGVILLEPLDNLGPENCYCENWKNCAYDDPGKCSCCDHIGGCKPPKGGPSCH
jgi:hypothetical protein